MGDTFISKIFAGVELLNPGGQCFTCFNSLTGKMVLSLNVGTSIMVLQGTLIVETIDAVTVMIDMLQLGDPPVLVSSALLQLYDNDADPDAQIVVQQAGTGDVGMRLLLGAPPGAADANYYIGIDNSANNDPFKIAASEALGTSDVCVIDHVDCNIGIGLDALGSIVAGATNNVAYGNLALAAVTTEDENTAVGCEALEANIANQNTAVGFQALTSNIGATNNTAVGWHSMLANDTGTNNTAVGYASLDINT